MVNEFNDEGIGVFIDYEYVFITLERLYGVPMDLEVVIEGIHGKTKQSGKIILERAYAPWSNFVEGLAQLSKWRVETVNISSKQVDKTDVKTGQRCAVLQNNADIYIAWDIAQLIYTNQNIHKYALVTGDGDFVEIVKRAQQNGKRVIVMGFERNTSDFLRTQADQFVSLDDLARANESAIAERIVDLGLDMEQRLDYVGYKLLIDILSRENPQVNFRELVHRIITEGVFITERRPDPASIKGEVFVVIPNRKHPLVRERLQARGIDPNAEPEAGRRMVEPSLDAPPAEDHSDPNFVGGVEAFEKKKFEEAADRFEKYLGVYDKDFSAYVMAIKALIELNRPGDLRNMCLRARNLPSYDQLSQRFPDWARFIDNKVAAEPAAEEAGAEEEAPDLPADDAPSP
jgi:uncharacterized LabA/DUF88 family protein